MPYRVLEKQVIYEGKRCRLEVHQLQNELTGIQHSREVVVHPGAILVMGFLNDGRVVLIRNLRHAIGRSLIELPAGTLEHGEEPIRCARRELLEETGYESNRIEPLLEFYTSPGILSERIYVFAAYHLQNHGAAPEEGEEIEVLPTDWAQAVEMCMDGRIQDGKTIATILWFDRQREAGRGADS